MNEMEILSLLLQATKSGNLQWNKTDFDCYSVSNIKTHISIKFFYPLLAGDTASEPDIAKVTVNRLVLTFFNGTEGMNFVRRILSHGLPEWSIHLSNVEIATNEAIEILKELASEDMHE